MYYSALLGNPTDHSISPQLFRILGEQFGIEYSHIKVDVKSKDLLPEYLDALKLLGFCVGAIQAIEKKLRKIKEDDKVCVFGAGGAATSAFHQ